MTPREVVKEFVTRFNAGDVGGLVEMYPDDAVNHQVPQEPVRDKQAIRRMFAEEFAAADRVCIPENIFEDGDWGILDWKDPLGLRGCGSFQVRDGKIAFQRGDWDKLTFIRLHGLPIATQ
jgi:hypothetical protein